MCAPTPYPTGATPVSKQTNPGRAKTYALVAIVSLIASYEFANFGVSTETSALAVWYALMSIATGIAGAGFSIGTAVVVFGWDD